MTERLTRKALYDLVWSEPTMTPSARVGIPDVALKKTCARAGILTPECGHIGPGKMWGRRHSGRIPITSTGEG